MKLWILILLVGYFFSACSLKPNSDKPMNFKSYQIKIVDTIKINFKGIYIVPIDVNYDNGNMLIIDKLSAGKIIQVNSKGDIINEINVQGEDGEKIGSIVSNVGYFNKKYIVVAGTRGYNFYDLEGKLVRKVKSPNPESGIFFYRIRHYEQDLDTILVSAFRSTVSFQEIVNDIGHKLSDKFRFYTFHNLEKDRYDILIKHEPQSMFIKDNYQYSPRTYFDLSNLNTLYVVHNPENKIYIYDLKNKVNLKNIIEITSPNFNVPYLKEYGDKTYKNEKDMSVNSEILGINTLDNYCLVSYKTGIPEQAYDEMKSMSELGDLRLKYRKYFTIIIDINAEKQVSNEIELPKNMIELLAFRSKNEVILLPNPSIIENPNQTVFYVGKLEEIK